jgi:muramoyltetrapeptide carboxypeptidase
MFIKPPLFKKGCTIGVVTPAAPNPLESLNIFKQQLTLLGYKVKISDNFQDAYGYLAGVDKTRAEAFMKIWLDPEVDVVWCSRGGYGSSRILPYLDFNLLKKHPKIFVGMSDITALHNALHNYSLVSYLGPTLSCLFPVEKEKSQFMHEECWKFFLQPKEVYAYQYPEQFEYPYKEIKKGVAQGKLVGGNLSLIVSLIGTPWQVDTKGKILILEDVNEAPYRIDRMLNQLHQSGSLEALAGLILGTFKGCVYQADKSLSLHQIFEHYFSWRKYPSISGFPTGHIDQQVILPLGCEVILDTASKKLQLLESPFKANSY